MQLRSRSTSIKAKMCEAHCWLLMSLLFVTTPTAHALDSILQVNTHAGLIVYRNQSMKQAPRDCEFGCVSAGVCALSAWP